MKRIVSLFITLCSLATAGAISFTEQGQASGSLGGTNFTDALVTIVLIGDTTTVFTTSGSPGLYQDLGVATLSVAGIGSATFTDQMAAFDSQNVDWAGISDYSHLDEVTLVTINALFGSYALSSSIGPASGPAFIDSGDSFPTTAGSLILTSASNSTFTAATPEPGSIGVVCLGLIWLRWIWRYRDLTTRS